MTDPLIEMMGEFTKGKTYAFLDQEAGELSELAFLSIPWIIKLSEDQQNQLLFFAYRYAEERQARVLH